MVSSQQDNNIISFLRSEQFSKRVGSSRKSKTEQMSWKGKYAGFQSIKYFYMHAISLSASRGRIWQLKLAGEYLACVVNVPIGSERNSGHAKEFFRVRAARKIGREQKGVRKGVGEGKEGNACPQTPWFWKTRSPMNGAPDWCGVAILIDKGINFAWMIPVITRAWLAQFVNLCLTWMKRIRIYSEDAI